MHRTVHDSRLRELPQTRPINVEFDTIQVLVHPAWNEFIGVASREHFRPEVSALEIPKVRAVVETAARIFRDHLPDWVEPIDSASADVRSVLVFMCAKLSSSQIPLFIHNADEVEQVFSKNPVDATEAERKEMDEDLSRLGITPHAQAAAYAGPKTGFSDGLGLEELWLMNRAVKGVGERLLILPTIYTLEPYLKLYEFLSGRINPHNTKVKLRGLYTSQCVHTSRDIICDTLNIPVENTLLDKRHSIDFTGRWPIREEADELRRKVADGTMSPKQWRSTAEKRVDASYTESRRYKCVRDHMSLSNIRTYLWDEQHYGLTYGKYEFDDMWAEVKRRAGQHRTHYATDVMELADFLADPIGTYKPPILGRGYGFDLSLKLPWNATEQQVMQYRNHLARELAKKEMTDEELQQFAREYGKRAREISAEFS